MVVGARDDWAYTGSDRCVNTKPVKVFQCNMARGYCKRVKAKGKLAHHKITGHLFYNKWL